ncbi:short-chain fatty acyl-CoA regulator family protein [Notoacmeibacter sp. MSK16QG-6]|uniref:helix-turn-helix domain-containing protein n=1 Tax=Notoacmeibacter sp. MSK16QG-6 TaxID=2957982 RepID=UPI00209CCB9E|nr:XRE family transcriptional regulator [Notoacmeibacter sp. MSK16QG-6]MCP1198967.1 short-chain fatty acyl-CoA regulator family protein [Notoacmeibacter sp. MSK16QG-6]
MRDKKIFVGRKIRAVRQHHKLTQAAFAARLGISTSYLNQLENNQRHITAPVLLALADKFSVEMRDFAGGDEDRLLADLAEAFADPAFGGQQPAPQDIQLVVQNTPAVALAVLSLHRSLRQSGERLAALDDTIERSGVLVEPTPYEEVRDYFHYIDNYIEELDRAGEALAEKLGTGGGGQLTPLTDYAERRCGIRIVIETGAAVGGTLRHYDEKTRVLRLNSRSGAATNAFQIAHQIGLIECRDMIDAVAERADFHSEDAAAVCRIGLANYFAGAALLPYRRFLEAARELRHDLDLLAERFGASIEQVAHRLSTMQRPGEQGIPFFFARVDRAGNITKRHSATKLQFARFGSACPLWNVHRAFEAPNSILRQQAETPDGRRYLCLATVVTKPSAGFHAPVQTYALSLGCEIEHASRLVYADDLDLARDTAFEPIGISCRICERIDCHQRAVPPLKRPLTVEPNHRGRLPYSF